MAITVTWATPEKTAFYWRFEGKWNWIEYADAMNQSNTLAREVAYPIDVIVDLRASSLLPSNILSHIKLDKAAEPEKLGRVALLGANLFVRRITDALSKINRTFENKFITAETLEEALDRLTRNAMS